MRLSNLTESITEQHHFMIQTCVTWCKYFAAKVRVFLQTLILMFCFSDLKAPKILDLH